MSKMSVMPIPTPRNARAPYTGAGASVMPVWLAEAPSPAEHRAGDFVKTRARVGLEPRSRSCDACTDGTRRDTQLRPAAGSRRVGKKIGQRRFFATQKKIAHHDALERRKRPFHRCSHAKLEVQSDEATSLRLACWKTGEVLLACTACLSARDPPDTVTLARTPAHAAIASSAIFARHHCSC